MSGYLAATPATPLPPVSPLRTRDAARISFSGSDPERGTARLTFQLDAEGAPTRLMVEDWGEFQRRG